MKELLIVTMTSYGKRLLNIPVVFDTIFAQTVKPDLVVLNISIDETVPQCVMDYLVQHNVEINLVPDTKVYKKLIPTLNNYPEACVICIDDDFLYPERMIADFLWMHEQYPNNPISGNRVVVNGLQCHCGCASMTKAHYYGEYLSQIDDDVIQHCPSDDMLFTFFAAKNGHPYLRTNEEYFINLNECSVDSSEGYSKAIGDEVGIMRTLDYLQDRFGPIRDVIGLYIQDKHIAVVLESIQTNLLIQTEKKIRSSLAYRLGKALLTPFKLFKR